ncbi:FadR/GntR family transcriptional regulator [Ornithinicoccus halotolerans]|uniref:FadR/GntR family transcriptional regulator n=1 Tax=Ornithinicoccus halotolerans TaxID=1748220 RepID=UPI001E302531|nr:FadR/GntR family transcriptional regulator [Ornithinicoccus halotolerans]
MTMALQLEPLDRAKTYELVVRRLKDEIFAGRLRPGDRLPGERQLSELLQVSRPSVREALRTLQAMEIVRTRPGAGPSSGLIVSAEPNRALTDLLGLHVALSSYSVVDVLTVRMVLEMESVRRLATRVQEVDLSPVREALEEMARPDIDRKTFHEFDTEFHVELARGSKNVLLADLMAALKEAVRRPMDSAFEGDPDWAEHSQGLLREHQQILDAVSRGDADGAAELMRHHIEGFYSVLRDGE